ncbi:MAG: CocE/NonD family hydrolase [Acidobacteriota bacterium]|nr:MAG: CocE/NonD family hydrolase [Acidobacteriota bacterium]
MFDPVRCGAGLGTILIGAAIAISPGIALTELSGTVSSEETGLPLEAVTVGVTRDSVTAGLELDDPIPVEWTAETDASGFYRLDLDESLPGMDRLFVFTHHHTVFNELYPSIDTRGMAPWREDVGEPGVVTLDLTTGPATGIDLEVASSKRAERITMRDGITELATDVWLPSRRSGMSWPTLLNRTPYGRGDPPRRLILGDYAVVIQNTRGRNDSDGIDDVFDDDGWLENQDGYDTVEWIAAQGWCNGRVGTFGGSAHGITQYLVAGAAPPSLVCAVAEIASGNPYQDMAYPGGEFRKHLVETWLANQGSSHKLDEYFAHPNEDAYWDDRNLLLRANQVVIPILHIGGWYDIFTQGTLDAFRILHERGGPGARRNQKLIIGPWVHGLYVSPFQGELWYPTQSLLLDYEQAIIRWYDFWMKGNETGIMDEPPARAYVMGPGLPEASTAPGNFWRTSDSWPPPATPTPFYLQPGGVLTDSPPPSEGGESSFLSDPANPVPTRGGNNLYEDIGVGPFDQRPVDDIRADVLVWQTAPLSEPIEASGPIRFVLYASSDRPDTDWVVKLEDVYPDGRAMLVTDLILVGRHRVSLREEDLLGSGVVYQFEVKLWDTSITFPAGHRIRVALASSNYPRFEINPQTGEPFHQHTHQEVATNRIQHHASAPSHLELSVVDPGSLIGCRPTEHVSRLTLERVQGAEVRLTWDPTVDPCHRRYRVYAGKHGAQWPWIVRRPVAETEATTLVSADEGLFWQVVSEGTDGSNGPHGSP